MRFVCDSGYLPVLKDANSVEALDEVIQNNNLEISDKTYDCLKTILQNANTVKSYTSRNFDNGYQTRKVLDSSLADRAAQDKKAIDDAVAAGSDREEVLAEYTSDESFEEWYQSFCDDLEKAAAGE